MSDGLVHLLMTSLLLGLVTMATIVGNVFVMVAIGVERHLRVNVANYLIASLAVADLLVAALVMPLAAVNDVTRGWPLGRHLCDAWVSFDVLCCTSSILHLVAISLDRYWAVTRVDYIHNRSALSITQKRQQLSQRNRATLYVSINFLKSVVCSDVTKFDCVSGGQFITGRQINNLRRSTAIY